MSRNHNNHADAKTTTRDVNAAQRAALAIKLRASKLTYEKIAQQAGYADRQTAHKAVQRELQRTVVSNVEELRREESVTLDIMQTECMKMFLDKENKGRLFAADRLLAIMERRARLFGLDAKPDAIPDGVTIIRSYGVEILKV